MYADILSKLSMNIEADAGLLSYIGSVVEFYEETVEQLKIEMNPSACDDVARNMGLLQSMVKQNRLIRKRAIRALDYINEDVSQFVRSPDGINCKHFADVIDRTLATVKPKNAFIPGYSVGVPAHNSVYPGGHTHSL